MFSGLGYTEMLMVGIIALMLFGSRLPDVAKNFGRTYRDLRKKVDDFQKEFRDWDKDVPTPTKSSVNLMSDDEPERSEPKAPKFSPPSDDD